MPSPTAAPRTRRRRQRERDILAATRALFDERGLQDAPIDDIARSVGINKALIYRHFSSKEELFILTVTGYLDELRAGAAELALEPPEDPEERLRALCDHFAGFCLRYPAFLDCALSLMRRPARDLRELVSESVWFRLGQAMAASLAPLAAALAAGRDAGRFAIDDPDLVANQLYAQVLGAMHLARVGAGVRCAAPGVPEVFAVDPDVVRRACVDGAMALARVG